MTTAQKRISGSHLAVLAKFTNRIPFEEGLRKANDQKLVIASNKRLSNALVGSDEWQRIQAAFLCWSGTMTAYEVPGKKFGQTIEYVDPKTTFRWVFPVPEQFQGETNAILVAEHPDYTLEVEGRNRVVHATQVDLVKSFPEESKKWYKGDTIHDIPQGIQVNSDDEDSRQLWRIDKRVGPVPRGYHVNVGRNVFLVDNPSSDFGVVVEAKDHFVEN